MTGRLNGKVALVTAAGQGIGRAIAAAFIDEGAGVIATDVDEGKLKGLNARECRALDVLPAKDIDALAAAVPRVFGVPNRYVYSLTKAAVIGLTKAIAMDFIKRGVRVNAICPGTMESPSFRDRVAAHAKRSGISVEAAEKDFIDRQPMGRIGTAEEVAMLATYLASDESAFISGHTHLIDGGWAL